MILPFGGDALLNETKEDDRLALICRDSAKQLYNLAILTVGDRELAEQAAYCAFSDTYRQLSGTSDASQVQTQCVRHLYRYGKKAFREAGEQYSGAASDTPYGCNTQYAAETNPLARLLDGLSYSEKYILLLFCRLKFTTRQIAEITGLPVFIVERRLNTAAAKASRRAG